MSQKQSFYKTLVTLALPISLQNLISFTVNFADNLMVGRLGNTIISGVFIGNQIHSFLQFIVGGVSAVLVILAAQYWGKRDLKSIRSITALCVWAAVFAGAVFTFFSVFLTAPLAGVLTGSEDVIAAAVPYLRIVGISFIFFSVSQILIASLRSVENVKFGMRLSVVTLCINVSLNYCLIFGKLGFPALGITGAAIATLVSRILETAIVLVYIFVIDKRINLRPGDLGIIDRYFVKALVKYGSLVVAGDIVWAVNGFAYTVIVGRFGADTIAAFNITGMMNTLVYVWMSGLASAVGIITGKMVGSGDTGGIKPYAYRVQRLFLCVGIFTGLFVFFTKGILISMYNITPEAIRAANLLMTVMSFTIAGTSYQMSCLFGLVKSGGNISFVFKNDTIFVFLVVIPSAVIALVNGAPSWVVLLCLRCDQILKCFVAAVVVNRFKWIRDLTKPE